MRMKKHAIISVSFFNKMRPVDQMSRTKKTVLITGGASGISV